LGKDKVDVLVIGAGASGAAFSWSLAQSGINVMCLEQGKWLNPLTDYSTFGSDWEIHRQTDFNPNPNLRANESDYPVNDTNTPIKPLMYNAVGGSTIHWSAHFPRMKPSDFRVKTLDGVAEDWPISYHELEPYFDQNDKIMGVAGLKGDPGYPEKSPRQTPPVGLGKLGTKISSGFDKLGWHWWPSDSAINTVDYDGRSGCNNCGPCDLGCPIKAKASTDVTYWPKAVSMGVQLVTNARVREITIDDNGNADGAVYYDSMGIAQVQKASIVVMACNGIGTPRILLNSKSGKFPNGLANSSGLVGKNFMFHPYASVFGTFDEDLEGHKGPTPLNLMCSEFYETDLSRGFVRGYSYQVTRSKSPLATAIGPEVPWGARHHEEFHKYFNRTVRFAVIAEDLPELHNEIVLDPELTDSDGIPAPKVNYTLSENSRKMLAHGIETSTQVMKAAGAIEVNADPLIQEAGWHLMGTTKMGTNPESSVVDQYCRSHDVKNLFVVDGSVFVTSGGVNPTSTIQAIALYVADYVKNNAKNILG
jgi:choline dehydrogenase-like flavoprotein|tara:strand:- start:2716 stop:4314 length:1599 start_codon:yes stop_codon:yes gene_type:complete